MLKKIWGILTAILIVVGILILIFTKKPLTRVKVTGTVENSTPKQDGKYSTVVRYTLIGKGPCKQYRFNSNRTTTCTSYDDLIVSNPVETPTIYTKNSSIEIYVNNDNNSDIILGPWTDQSNPVYTAGWAILIIGIVSLIIFTICYGRTVPYSSRYYGPGYYDPYYGRPGININV